MLEYVIIRHFELEAPTPAQTEIVERCSSYKKAARRAAVLVSNDPSHAFYDVVPADKSEARNS